MGNSHPKLLSSTNPIVVVLGGGYAGVSVAQSLDATGQYRVVLIDRKNYFLHNIGALRAATENNYASNILIPYTNLLKNGAVIQAEIKEITDKNVFIYGHPDPIPFDYLVIALGSNYAFPGKISEPNRENAIRRYQRMNEKINNAKSIMVVGGGAVGVELVGEIREQYKDKSITLIHSHDSLLPSQLKQELRDRVLTELKKLNINVVLNSSVILSEEQKNYLSSTSNSFIDSAAPSSIRTVSTSNGQSFSADLIMFATGTKTNNSSLKNYFQSLLNEEGRLSVDDHLRVTGLSNIFAVGDIANAGPKMAWFAQLQAAIVSDNIKILSNAKSKGKTSFELKSYNKNPLPAMFVTMGKTKGAGQMPNASGTIVGNTLVPMIKGKDLFVSKNWGILNAASIRSSIVKNDLLSLQNNNDIEEKVADNNNDNQSEKNNMKGIKKEFLDVRARNLSTVIGVSEMNAQSMIITGLPLPEHPNTIDAL